MEDIEEDLVVQTSIEKPHGLDPPEPNPMLILGGLVDALRMAGLRTNPRHV